MSDDAQSTSDPAASNGRKRPPHRVGADWPFIAIMGIIGGLYVTLLVGMLLADVAYLSASEVGGSGANAPEADGSPAPPATNDGTWVVWRPVSHIMAALADPNIRYSVKLTLVSCLLTTILSLVVAVPLGYLLSRYRFPGRNLLDSILDIPIVLPPLVVGLSLLILFQFWPFRLGSRVFVFQVPGVVLAQFMVAAAFAIRTMRATFDQIDTWQEKVALTLGCNQAQAFMLVAFPRSWHGMLTAATLAWARALGEFGPLLIFAGATRNKTEVLSTTVFLEMSIGNLEAAVAVSLLMVAAAVTVLVIARVWGTRALSL
jgi:molybdate transport system permease protein